MDNDIITIERIRLAKIINEMAMEYPPGKQRVALVIAAKVVERGRRLTATEQMNNLKKSI